MKFHRIRPYKGHLKKRFTRRVVAGSKRTSPNYRGKLRTSK